MTLPDKSDVMEEEYTVDDDAFSGPPDSQTFMDLDVQTDANHSDVVDQGVGGRVGGVVEQPGGKRLMSLEHIGFPKPG